MSSITLRRVRMASESGSDAVAVTLFRDEHERVCGWFIGPLQIGRSGVDMAYLAPAERALASVAIVRAIDAARKADLTICVVDPDDLWGTAWV